MPSKYKALLLIKGNWKLIYLYCLNCTSFSLPLPLPPHPYYPTNKGCFFVSVGRSIRKMCVCGGGWGEVRFFFFFVSNPLMRFLFLPNLPAKIASERFLSPLSTYDRYKKPMHFKIQKLSMVNDEFLRQMIAIVKQSEWQQRIFTLN